jgi:iron complex outermembrane receptor protein
MCSNLYVRRLIILGLFGASFEVQTSFAADASGQPESQSDSGTLQEVIVTATKRAESEVNVPSSISVLSAATLETLGVQDFSDYSRVVPGVSVQSASAPGHGQIIIRGVTSGVNQNAPTTAVYLDEIPFTDPSPLSNASGTTFDPDLADIERVEVLKGPQSTLYGASAMGGIVRVITTQPSLTDFVGNVRVDGGSTQGGDASYGVRGAINIPLVNGIAALRITGFDRHDGGFVNNVETGQNNVNSDESKGARLSLRVQPTDGVDTTFSALYQDLYGNGVANEYLNPHTLQPLYGQRDYSDYFNPAYHIVYQAISNTTTADLGFADFTNNVSYLKTTNSTFQDYTASYGIALFNAATPAGAGLLFNNVPITKRVTEEARLSSKSDGPFEWLGGLYYTNEHDNDSGYLHGLYGATGEPLPAPYFNSYTYDSSPTYREWAVFGDVTYHFTQQLEATAGVRHSANDQYFDFFRSGLLGSTEVPPGTSSDSANTYLLTLSFHPDRFSTLYIRAASGFRPGSTQAIANESAPAKYGPDSLWNYEAGYKGEWLNGRLTAETAYYHINWTKIQLNSIINGFTVIGNAGDARIDGAEATVTFQPVSGIKVSGNVNFADARLVTNNASIGAVAGDQLPYAPRLVANLFADYQHPMTADVTGRVGLGYSYQGNRYTSFSEDPLNTRYLLPGYGILDMHTGLDWQRYSFDLRVSNITNNIGITSIQDIRIVPNQAVPAIATITRPRTVIASLEVKF